MSTNRLFSTLLVIVVMGTVALTIRESAATSAVVQRAREARRIQLSQDAENARWLAMARFYEKQPLMTDSPLGKPLTSYDEAEATAYRWQAMAKFYLRQQGIVCSSQLPKPLTEYDAAEADAYRWQAICNYYVQDSLAKFR